MNMLFIGTAEIIFIFFIILIFFGSSKIPDIARTLGKTIRYFHNAADQVKADIMDRENDIKDVKNKIENQAKQVKESIKRKVNDYVKDKK